MNNNNFFQGTPKKEDPPRSWLGSNTSQPSPFGTPNNGQNTSISPFQSNQSIFGQKPAGMFGSAQPAAPTTNSFGSSSFSPFASGNSGFGNTPKFGSSIQPSFGSTPQSGFGSNTTMSGFGNTTQPTFGSTTQPTFGNTTQPTFGSTTQPAFGNTTQPTFGNSTLLGNSQQQSFNMPTFGSNTQSGFGNTTQPGFGNSTLFGNSTVAPQQNSFGPSTAGSSWNAPAVSGWQSNDKGSKIAPYSSSRVMDDNNVYVDLTDITGMKDYNGKSVDEIRKEDYEMSLCPPKPGSTPFISTGNTTFGTAQPSSGIGLPFASSSQFGSSMFGSTAAKPGAPLATPSPNFSNNSFASPAQPASTGFTSNSTSMFGQAPANNTSNTSMFGQGLSNNTASNGMFGQGLSNNTSNTTMFGQGLSNNTANNTASTTTNPTNSLASNNMFNQTPLASNTTMVGQNPASNNNMFGQTTPSTNMTNSSTLFGQNPVTNNLATFGQTNQFSNNSSLFGQTPPTTSGSSIATGSANPFASVNNPFNMSSRPNDFNLPQQSQINSQFQFKPQQSNNDPYLLKNVNFDKFEQQKPTVRILPPAPIFKTRKECAMVDLHIRPPRQISKNSFYTIPDIRDIGTSQYISNLVIGFEGKGRIEFLEPVTIITAEDIERRVSFRNEGVEISDPIGTGLNKKARVFVEGIFPMCRGTNEIIKGKCDSFPQKGIQERFIYQLKNDPSKIFVDYNVDTGIYVYEVNHF